VAGSAGPMHAVASSRGGPASRGDEPDEAGGRKGKLRGKKDGSTLKNSTMELRGRG